jgi:hypothetical protein
VTLLVLVRTIQLLAAAAMIRAALAGLRRIRTELTVRRAMKDFDRDVRKILATPPGPGQKRPFPET